MRWGRVCLVRQTDLSPRESPVRDRSAGPLAEREVAEALPEVLPPREDRVLGPQPAWVSTLHL